MPNNVTMVRPDGSTLQVSEDDAAHLRVLGYKDETPEAERGAAVEAATEQYYSTPAQKIKTAAEGAASGLTLGLADVGFRAAGLDSAERAQYNPGVRLGSEIAGGILPGFFAPESLLSYSPAGALVR